MPTITGTDSSETLAGTTGDDQISALGGSDTITVSSGNDVIDGGTDSDTISGTAASLPGLPASARSYLLTSGHFSDGSGTLDTSFSNVEQVRFADFSGYDVTFDASAYSAFLQFNVGGGHHTLTGGSGSNVFVLAVPQSGDSSAVIDGGAGDDMLAFLVAPDSQAVLSNSGDLVVVTQGTTRSAELHNIETIAIQAVGAATSGLLVDASQIDRSISFFTTDSRPDIVVGGSAGDVFETYFDGAGDTLTGSGGADRYVFGRYDPYDFDAFDGTTITDFDADDVIDLNALGGGYPPRTFVGNDEAWGANQYRSFRFNDATFVADWGPSLLKIASGAFILAETAPGSNLLMIAGPAPALDAGANVLAGTARDDVLEGGAGDDQISAGDGDDLIGGGADNDQLRGGKGSDSIYGGSGNDTIDGGEGFDTIRGEDGNDTLKGTGFENDWMMGGRGDDTLIAQGGVWHLYGGDDPAAGWGGSWYKLGGEDLSGEDDGDDRITLTNGHRSSIDGGSGDDTITVAGGQKNVVGGGSGNDTIKISGASAIAVDGGAGDDKITVSASEQVVVLGNAGDDALTGDAGNDTLDGGDGNDTLIGGDGDDWLRGDAGIDTVSYAAAAAGVTVSLGRTSAQHTGGAGIDRVAEVENATGSAFDDILRGNDAANDLRGGDGADRLEGGLGDDTLNGGNGDDVLTGGGGGDAMRGGAGDDLYYVDAAGDLVIEGVGAGWEVVRAGADYTLTANVEELFIGGAARNGSGNALANTLHGSGSNNVLLGLAGDDIIRGGGGRDTIDGGDGADLLDGGVGKDTLTGGAARDVFQFRDGDFGANRSLADLITDFSHADAEKIHLGLVDADTAIAGNQAFAFLGTGAFTGVAGQLHYAQAGGNTYVEGDTNGDGTADFVVALTGLHNLVASDFVL